MTLCQNCGGQAVVATITDSAIGTYQHVVCFNCGHGMPRDRWAEIQASRLRIIQAPPSRQLAVAGDEIRSIFEGWAVSAQLSETLAADARQMIEQLLEMASEMPPTVAVKMFAEVDDEHA